MVGDNKGTLDREAVEKRDRKAGVAQAELWKLEQDWEANAPEKHAALQEIKAWLLRHLGNGQEEGAGYKRLGQVLLGRKSYAETIDG